MLSNNREGNRANSKCVSVVTCQPASIIVIISEYTMTIGLNPQINLLYSWWYIFKVHFIIPLKVSML